MSAIAAMAAARKGRLAPVFIVFAALLAGLLLPAVSPAAPRASAAAARAHAATTHRQLLRKRHAREAAKARQARRRAARARPAIAYGINAGGLLQQPADRWPAVLAQFSAAGMTFVRADASRSGIEATPGVYDFSSTDRLVAALAKASLRWYPMVGYSSAWSGVSPGDLFSRPADPSGYVAFAAALAKRYGTGGSFWGEHPELPALPTTRYEIWNEENAHMFWREQATAPEDYADLYAATRAAIRRVDPTASVVVGGLVEMGSVSFISRFFAHRPDLRGKVDAIGYHTYNPSAGDMLSSMSTIRAAINAVDPGVPIDITEAGFSTVGMSEARRSANLSALVSGVAAHPKLGVRSLLYFSAMTEYRDPTSWFHWLGLWNLDGTPKLSATALLAAVRSQTLS